MRRRRLPPPPPPPPPLKYYTTPVSRARRRPRAHTPGSFGRARSSTRGGPSVPHVFYPFCRPLVAVSPRKSSRRAAEKKTAATKSARIGRHVSGSETKNHFKPDQNRGFSLPEDCLRTNFLFSPSNDQSTLNPCAGI